MALFSGLPPGEQIKRWLSILTALIILLDLIAAATLFTVTTRLQSIVRRHEPVVVASGDIAAAIYKAQTGLYQYLGEYRKDTGELRQEIARIRAMVDGAQKLEAAAEFGPSLTEMAGNLAAYEKVVTLLPTIGTVTDWDEVEEVKNQAMESGRKVEGLAAKMKDDATRSIGEVAENSRRVTSLAMYVFAGFFLLSVVIIVLLFVWWRSFQEMMLSL